MRVNGLFGTLFLLFWAIPFPMIMYYNLSAFSNGSTPVMALVWLAAALVLSALLLWRLFKRLILLRYIAIKNLNNLMKNGDINSAKIILSTPMTPEFAGVNKYQLTLELQNFVGTIIRESMTLNDSKPELHSFDTGKTIKVRIDKTLKNVPYIQLDGAHYNKATPRGLILGGLLWVIVACVIAGYYVYSYKHQNNGTGWRFLEWDHPLIISQAILLAISYFVRGGRLTKNQLLHKYYGYETQAQVISAAQTGTYINNQPVVRFNLQYLDKNNSTRNASFTKTIGVLDTAMAQQKTMDIFYLADDPGNICLATDLQN